MKGKLIGLFAALLIVSASLAYGQGKDHDKDKDRDKTHSHHIVHKKVKTNTTATMAASKARPWYHPKKRYSDAEWKARIAASHQKTHHKPRPWWKPKPKAKHTVVIVRKPVRHHSTPWWKVRHHRRTKRTIRIVNGKTHHDNGKHLGWQKGRGNPHRH